MSRDGYLRSGPHLFFLQDPKPCLQVSLAPGIEGQSRKRSCKEDCGRIFFSSQPQGHAAGDTVIKCCPG